MIPHVSCAPCSIIHGHIILRYDIPSLKFNEFQNWMRLSNLVQNFQFRSKKIMAYKDQVPYMFGGHGSQVIHVILEPGLLFQEIVHFIIPAYFHVYAIYLAYTLLFYFCVYGLYYSQPERPFLSPKTTSLLSVYTVSFQLRPSQSSWHRDVTENVIWLY